MMDGGEASSAPALFILENYIPRAAATTLQPYDAISRQVSGGSYSKIAQTSALCCISTARRKRSIRWRLLLDAMDPLAPISNITEKHIIIYTADEQ